MIGGPKYFVDGNILAFDIQSQMGLHFGFRFDLGFSDYKLANANIKMKSSSIDLQLNAIDANRFEILATASASGKETKRRIAGDLDFLNWVNNSYYYFSKTPIAMVTKKASKLALERLEENLDNSFSMLVVDKINKDEEELLLVDAGSESGLEVGMDFLAYNTKHYWSGLECESKYLGKIHDFKKTVKLRVREVYEGLSVLGTDSSLPSWLGSLDEVFPATEVR